MHLTGPWDQLGCALNEDELENLTALLVGSVMEVCQQEIQYIYNRDFSLYEHLADEMTCDTWDRIFYCYISWPSCLGSSLISRQNSLFLPSLYI